MNRSIVGCVFAAATACLLHPGAEPLVAQTSIDLSGGPALMVGYSAKPTDQMYGAGAMFFPGGRFGGWGLLVDGRVASNRPPSDELREGRTPLEAQQDGDTFIRSRGSWNSFNAGIVRGIGSELALYVGGGLAKEKVYSEYTFEEIGDGTFFFGSYWIDFPARDRTEPNVIGGAIYRMGSRIALQMGIQTAPRGFSVGGYLLLF